jgi:hypothetical protein
MDCWQVGHHDSSPVSPLAGSCSNLRRKLLGRAESAEPSRAPQWYMPTVRGSSLLVHHSPCEGFKVENCLNAGTAGRALRVHGCHNVDTECFACLRQQWQSSSSNSFSQCVSQHSASTVAKPIHHTPEL